MNILGIETSCDETSASVVVDGRVILSNVVASSLKDHSPFGGIIPEIASRRQMELIDGVVHRALTDAQLKLQDIDVVAVTTKPGLMGSLVVGISFARALAYAIGKPLIEVDHIQGHLYANFLRSVKETDNDKPKPKLPAIGLVVSGGHTSLFEVKTPTKMKLLGQTRDDAAGEAFDKVARILELGYPGGPVIDRLAREHGEEKSLRFPVADLKGSLDFSFSGLKTAVLYHYQKHHMEAAFNKSQVVTAFQQSVVTALVEKTRQACMKKKIKTVLIGGGVAANSGLRKALDYMAGQEGLAVFSPPMSLCLDNAAMIAGIGFHQYKK